VDGDGMVLWDIGDESEDEWDCEDDQVDGSSVAQYEERGGGTECDGDCKDDRVEGSSAASGGVWPEAGDAAVTRERVMSGDYGDDQEDGSSVDLRGVGDITDGSTGQRSPGRGLPIVQPSTKPSSSGGRNYMWCVPLIANASFRHADGVPKP